MINHPNRNKRIAPRFLITKENEGGELDRREVSHERHIRGALTSLINGHAYFHPGTVFRVSEIEEK